VVRPLLLKATSNAGRQDCVRHGTRGRVTPVVPELVVVEADTRTSLKAPAVLLHVDWPENYC
jgi:hypothetical protein